tara:strand:- start:12323 stop:13906 length:1584 start_codon:yes stop_codon:yes gene_type:complete
MLSSIHDAKGLVREYLRIFELDTDQPGHFSPDELATLNRLWAIAEDNPFAVTGQNAYISLCPSQLSVTLDILDELELLVYRRINYLLANQTLSKLSLYDPQQLLRHMQDWHCQCIALLLQTPDAEIEFQYRHLATIIDDRAVIIEQQASSNGILQFWRALVTTLHYDNDLALQQSFWLESQLFKLVKTPRAREMLRQLHEHTKIKYLPIMTKHNGAFMVSRPKLSSDRFASLADRAVEFPDRPTLIIPSADSSPAPILHYQRRISYKLFITFHGQQCSPLYKPPHITIAHELIHCLHGYAGTLDMTVNMLPMARYWMTTNEEKKTIQDDPFSENVLLAERGFPPRLTHHGYDMRKLKEFYQYLATLSPHILGLAQGMPASAFRLHKQEVPGDWASLIGADDLYQASTPQGKKNFIMNASTAYANIHHHIHHSCDENLATNRQTRMMSTEGFELLFQNMLGNLTRIELEKLEILLSANTAASTNADSRMKEYLTRVTERLETKYKRGRKRSYDPSTDLDDVRQRLRYE